MLKGDKKNISLALGFFGGPFLVFAFLVFSGAGNIVFINHFVHLLLLLSISLFAFYVAFLSYGIYDKSGDSRAFAISLSFYVFAFFFLVHGLIVPDLRQKLFLFNPYFFRVTLHYGLFLGSLALLGLVFPFGAWKKAVYGNRLKIFAGGILFLFSSFVLLMIFPSISEFLNNFSGAANVFTGAVFFLALISLLVKPRENPSRFNLYLIPAFAVLSNLGPVSLFSKEWTLAWWYFHLVFLAGFGLIFLAISKSRGKGGDFERVFALEQFPFGIRTKMTAAFILVGVAPIIAFGYLSFINFSRILTDMSLEKVRSANSARAGEVDCFFGPLKNDIVFLSKAQELEALAGARSAGDSDLEKRRLNLERVFKILMEAKPGAYAQIRYLDENGNEVVRLNSDGENIFAVPPEQLRYKGDRYYFTKAMKLSRGELYVSPLDLNREGSPPRVQKPFTPVIRYAAPVFGPAGERRGVIVTNAFAGEFLSGISEKADAGRKEEVFLVDGNGFYISHPDESKAWGGPRDLNSGHNIKKDFPDLAPLVLSGKEGVAAAGDVAGYAPVSPGGENAWVFVSVIPKNELLAPVGALKGILFSLSLIIAALMSALAYALANSFTSPIRELSEVSQRIGAGDLKARSSIKSKDEMGRLAASFNNMADNLLEARRLPENILHSMKESLFVVDTQGKISEVNRAALDALGYEKEELVGKPINEVFARKGADERTEKKSKAVKYVPAED